MITLAKSEKQRLWFNNLLEGREVVIPRRFRPQNFIKRLTFHGYWITAEKLIRGRRIYYKYKMTGFPYWYPSWIYYSQWVKQNGEISQVS